MPKVKAGTSQATMAQPVIKEAIEEEDGNDVTYYMDEDGQYYYQPAQNMIQLDDIDQSTIEVPVEGPSETETQEKSDGSFQMVTLVPSKNSNGEISYVLVVQEEAKQLLNVKQEEMANDVYVFRDEEEEEEEEEPAPATDGDQEEETPKKKKNSKKFARPQFTCNFCSYASHRRYLLIRHMKTHSEERPHMCSVCERGFKTLASLQNHTNMHNGVKPHVCKFCEVAFTTSGELVRHVRYKHTHEKPHKCTECDYASVELSKLRRHVRCHTGERPYQCPHCTYASPDTFKLKRHLRTHTGEKPYKCDLCSMCFTQSNSLKAHRLIHNVSEKPVYACELCPAKCGRKTDLRIHVQKLHTSDKPLKCKRCGKTFPDRYSCKVHNKTHEGEKCYKCDLCPYASTTLRHLKSHMLKHTDEKPFACDECDQTFRQKQLLRRHQNLCHNPDYVPKPPKEKTHTCHECNRTFAHKGNLIRHLALHDPDSGHQERALALKVGRARKAPPRYADAALKDEPPVPTQVVKLDANEELRRGELVTMADGDGQQYVVLEVIQLEDGTEQHVAVVAPDYIAALKQNRAADEPDDPDEPGDDDDDDEPDDAEEDDEEAMEIEDVDMEAKMREHLKQQEALAVERSIKLEKDVDACFGFDEDEPDEEDEVFAQKLVLQLP